MSRSIHKTAKSITYGKSKNEVDAMFEENDPDVEELMKKTRYRRESINKRKVEKFTDDK